MMQKLRSPYLALTAMLSGFCNALLGAGGGILLTLLMGRTLKVKFADRRDLLSGNAAKKHRLHRHAHL